MAKKDATATIDEPIETKEFEELVTSLAPYKLDDETPSQTLERLLADRKEFEIELIARKKELQSLYDQAPRPSTGKFSFVEAFKNITPSQAERIFSSISATQAQQNLVRFDTKLHIIGSAIDQILSE